MRPQPPALEDIELMSVDLMTNGFYKIIWRRSRYAPFDGEKINVRYASAPLELVAPKGVPDVLGYKYHGAANRFSDELPLTPDAVSSSTGKISEDGFVRHQVLPEEEEDGKKVLKIGGSYGWVNPPPGAERYADVAIEPASVLRFNYVSFHNVALVPLLSAFDACDVSEAQVIGGNFDSPFDFSLQEYEVGEVLFILSSTESVVNSQPLQCQLGTKFIVTVIGDESDNQANEVEDSVESEGLPGGEVGEVKDSVGSDGVPGAVRVRAMVVITLSLAIFFC